jgi:D-methionine transport system substrate-binding protein
MKKLFTLLTLIITIITITGCSSNDDTEIEVIATQLPHAEILEFARPLLEEKGYTLKITTTSDYYFPNPAIAAKDADANYFQHIPFLDLYNENNPDFELVVAARVHIEPIGLYANAYDSLSEIPNGAEVLLSNSISDHGRALKLLESAGLITLKDDVDITASDFDISEAIESNPKALVFRTDVAPDFMISAYQNEEADLYIINSNYVLEGGLDPLTDSIYIEEAENNPYVNVVAVREDRLEDPKIIALVEVLESEAVKAFILETYGGAVIPS